MFNRMEIKVVGRENEDQKSEESVESDEDDFDLNESFAEGDPNKIS